MRSALWTPQRYQQEAAAHLTTRPHAGVFCDPGGGKTAITLEALRQIGGRALVVAPRLVCADVWPREVGKWEQFADLKTLVPQGSKRQALIDEEVADPRHDITLINPEVVPWFADRYAKTLQRKNPWHFLIIDESSKFKSAKAQRVKALRKVFKLFPRRVILTGTPAPHSLMDLWSQIYLLDGGERLGKTISEFRRRYFREVVCAGGRWSEWVPLPGAAEDVQRAISDIVIVISRELFPDMPELRVNDVRVLLPTEARRVYDAVERDLFAALDGGGEIMAENAMHAYQLCRQIASGATPDATIHDAKIDAMRDIIDGLCGKPVLVAYWYRAELAQLRAALGGDVPHIGGGTTATSARDTIRAWNAGGLPVLLAHPGAMAHGINLQDGGHDIIIYGASDSLELYQQLVARLYRRGATGQVRVHRLIAERTIDGVIARTIDNREAGQAAIMRGIAEYRADL